MNIEELLTNAAKAGASDVFIVAGLPFSYKLNGKIHYLNDTRLMPGIQRPWWKASTSWRRKRILTHF